MSTRQPSAPSTPEIPAQAAVMTRVPGLTEVPYPVQMEPNLVIEFYSR